MKSFNIIALLTACALAALPLCAQDNAGPPLQSPSPDNGPYSPPPDQGGPAPDPEQSQGAPDQTGADQPITFQTFYDNLAPMGTWIQTDQYGYVWQPNINDPDWAPYTEGHWVYSDAGWTWASDESFGWATYHYGRWVNLNGVGWCWVPGYTWAPAWVSWRYGDGYCGWAPLPPDSFVGIDYGGDGVDISANFHIGGDCDSYYGIGAGWYTFVPVIYLGYPNYRGHFCNRNGNYAIINRTTNVTNLYVARNGGPNGSGRGHFNGVTAGGPSLALVNAASQRPVQRVNITGASQPGRSTLANNSLALYAPHVHAGATGQPIRVGSTLSQTTVNRGVDVTQPLAVNRNLTATAPTSNQVQQAQLAQFSAPARAKVVTTSTPVNPVLQAPLTSMTPVAPISARTTQNFTPNSQHYPVTSPSAPMTTETVTHNYNNGVSSETHTYTTSAPSQQYNPFLHPPSGATSNGAIYHSQAVNNPQYQSPTVSGHTNPYVRPTQTTYQTQSSPTPAANNHSTAPAPASSQQSSQQSQSTPAPSNNNGSNNQNTSGNWNGGGYPGGGYHNSSGGGNSWGNHNH